MQRSMKATRAKLTSAAEQAASTTARRVYHLLKDEILSGELKPGAALNEARLAESQGTSKTPVREALAMLVQDRLVDLIPRQGYQVAVLSLVDLQDIFYLRRLLEPAAAALAAQRATPEQIARLSELANELFEDPAAENEVRSGARHRLFHALVAAASGNSRLEADLTSLFGQMQLLQLPGLHLRKPQEMVHRRRKELVAAIAAHDQALSYEIALRQVESSQRTVIDTLMATLLPPDAPTTSLADTLTAGALNVKATALTLPKNGK